MDKVLIPTDVWYEVLDELENNKELREKCYKEMKVLDDIALGWVSGSLQDEGRMYPRMKDYLYELSIRIKEV